MCIWVFECLTSFAYAILLKPIYFIVPEFFFLVPIGVCMCEFAFVLFCLPALLGTFSRPHFHFWIPFRFNVDSYCITSFSTTKMRTQQTLTGTSSFFSHCFFCAHLFFAHLFYVHPFKMLMHEFTSSIAFARVDTHATHWRIHVLRITSTFAFCRFAFTFLMFAVSEFVCRTFVKLTFVKLTFIRHKIHHFSKVNTTTTISQKSKWCKW